MAERVVLRVAGHRGAVDGDHAGAHACRVVAAATVDRTAAGVEREVPVHDGLGPIAGRPDDEVAGVPLQCV